MRALLVATALLLAGCTTDTPSTTVTVFAASSLKVPFSTLGPLYEQQHPGSTVSFTFAGSADLVAQLEQGAPADVLATADEVTMRAAKRTLPLRPRPFASNTMRIVVPHGNPDGVTGLSDLTDPALSVVLCAPQVPCGAATGAVEEAAGIDIAPVSEESAVTDVLGKVTSGQADAGIVYASDTVTAGDDITGIDIPEPFNVTNRYEIASVRAAGDQFIELVLSPAGQRALHDAGFGPR